MCILVIFKHSLLICTNCRNLLARHYLFIHDLSKSKQMKQNFNLFLGCKIPKIYPENPYAAKSKKDTPSSLNKIQRTMPGGYLTSSWTRGCTQNNFLHTEVFFPNQILTLLLTSCPTNFTEEKSSSFCFSRTI